MILNIIWISLNNCLQLMFKVVIVLKVMVEVAQYGQLLVHQDFKMV